MRDSIKGLDLRIFCNTDHWFSDAELGPILADESVWPSLAGSGSWDYNILGEKLSNIPGWKSIISQDLPGWLDQHSSFMLDKQVKNFLTVLSRVWDADEAEADRFGDENTRVMMLTALANAWDQIDFSNPQLHRRQIVGLLECTVSMAFSARINRRWGWVVHPSQSFTDAIMVCIGDAVARAGEIPRCRG
jgi:hypothetical protein